MKMKHNKRRNTAFLYEALVKELTKATLNKNHDKKNKIIEIMKKYFGQGDLKEELNLYKTLYETNGVAEKDAEKILNEVKRVYSGLGFTKIYDKQSELISIVNKEVDSKTFSRFVPNYKTLASISQIFNKKTSIKDRVLLEKQILKQMSASKVNQKMRELGINNSTMRIFTKSFNKTYGDLHEEQKELLSKFISSFKDNGLELKIFLNEELGRLKGFVNESLSATEIKEDEDLTNKIKRILEVINNFKGQYITENLLEKVLKIQNLAREIEKNE